MTDYVYRTTEKLPKKQWLKPLHFEARETDENHVERGRWRRVYEDHDGTPVVLVSKPKRNTKVQLPDAFQQYIEQLTARVGDAAPAGQQPVNA